MIQLQLPPRSFWYTMSACAMGVLGGTATYYITHSDLAGFLAAPISLVGSILLTKLLISKGVLPPG